MRKIKKVIFFEKKRTFYKPTFIYMYYILLEGALRMQFLQPLNQERERELLWKSWNGCQEAKDKLVEHNMRLVAYVTKKYRIPQMEPEDMISIGTIGLIKAVSSFNIQKKIKFATYATRCIQNEIFMHLRRVKNKTQDKYLDEVVMHDTNGHELSLLDTLGGEKEEVEKEVQLKEDIEILYDILGKLDTKEKMILEYRFGINREKKRQEEIAEEFQISQSYVSRIERKAIEKMREQYKKVVS